jgi:hypothetical protein
VLAVGLSGEAQAAEDAARAEQARLMRQCVEVGGKPSTEPGAVTRADLRGQGQVDWIVDTRSMICEGANTVWGGTAGQAVVLVPADGRGVRQVMTHDLRIEPGSPPTIRMTGGIDCAMGRTDRCSAALAWNGQAFVAAGQAAPARIQTASATAATSAAAEFIDLETVDGSYYDHNGSQMLVSHTDGVIAYAEPKASIRSAVRRGQVMFRGRIRYNAPVSGTAFVFKTGCAPAPYAVRGRDDEGVITLTGAAPIRAKDGCDIIGRTTTGPNSRLVFRSLMSP